MAGAAASERFEALDSWRGICALAVAVFHFSFLLKADFLRNLIMTNAYLFVDFFFVLSGFVVCHAYRDRLDRPRAFSGFVLRRFGRLWPLHGTVLLAMMLMVMAINLAGHHPDKFTIHAADGGYSLFALVLHTGLLTSVGLYGNAWNSPAWSIGAELYTYLLFAAVVIVAGRRLLGAALALVAAATLALLIFAPAYMNSTADFGLIRCVAGFFTGVAAYFVHEAWRGRALPLATLAEVAVVALAALFMVIAGNGPDEVHAVSVLAPAVFALAILVFAKEAGALSRLLHARPLRALGAWSYSIYMVHMPLLVLVGYGLWLYGDLAGASLETRTLVEGHAKQLYDIGQPATAALLAAFLGAVVALAAFTYRRIEAPARDRFNRMAKAHENPGRTIALRPRLGPRRPATVRVAPE